MKLWSHLEFSLRFAFFALAPLSVVYFATLFPVSGTIINVLVALSIFAVGERARHWVSRSRLKSWLLEEALAFEAYYRMRRPRPFLYYLSYPLLAPYWLFERDARREFVVFRGYTISGFLILLATFAWQYFARYIPELGVREFLPHFGLTLVVEMVLALSLLMPLATSVVHYVAHGQRYRLYVLLTVGVISSVFAVAYVATRRDPIVAYSTSKRVQLRTAANRRKAHQALLSAARASRRALLKSRAVEGDGKVLGEPLMAARAALQSYYKSDEVLAFNVWASPRKRPRAIVLYFEGRNQLRPIWVAVDGYGDEIKSPDRLPRGAFQAMRRASDGTADLLESWPEALD